MSNKLKLWFDKNINDIKGCLPNGEKGRWDIYLLFNAFLGIKILDDNNLITELKNRGYDISTIKFEITKKNSEIQPVTTKDLTLDMWDKSIVNKIKRLEKSIELNNKVKKDLKKQLDQLKQQLVEKDEEIKKLNWQLKDKDFIIKNLNHSLSVAPNANAGQRARIDELTKIVKEKDKEIKSLIADYEKRISQEQELMSNMEHQLTEKQNTIDEINKEFVQAVHDWRVLCAEKDKEIAHLKEKDNYHLRYELAGADETITNLKQQLEEKDELLKCYQEEEKLIADILGDKDLTLIGSRVHLKNLIVELKNKIKDKDIVIEEKDKEIEKLKQQYTILENENGKLTTELIMDKYKKAQKEVSFGKQLAIQELEKVREGLEPKYFDYEQINYLSKIINQQIKELKGERNERKN